MNVEEVPVHKTMNRSDIDRLTMELMMNKTHYGKYLAKQDPEKHRKFQENLRKIQKYKDQIIDMTHELLDDSTKQGVPEKHNTEINTAFQHYLKTCVQYFEIREIVDERETSNIDRENTLFGEMDEDIAPSMSEGNKNTYWGKNIKKTNRSNYLYTMDIYSRPSHPIDEERKII